MKKVCLILICVMAATCAWARQLSESEARAMAAAKVPALNHDAARVQVKGMAVNADSHIYMFNAPGGGFAIVAGDDRMPNPVLAYSDTGTLDAADCPPAFTEWLKDITALIKEGDFSGLSRSSLDYSTPVAPMVTTKWNQSSPYDGLTPLNSEGAHCPTGCVATAMAQIVNYWKYPQEGGLCEHSYTWNGRTISVDFRESRYDWANMADVYDNNSTEAQKDAVAKLMYDCGVAANMNYGDSESASFDYNAASGMVDILGYSTETRLQPRITMGEDEWFELVKGELDAGKPLLYLGATISGEGHAFVCDGYDTNGLYHINWGWGGLCDGYFDLNTLNPKSQGIGGAASGQGFSTAQSILSGCRPPRDSDVAVPGWEIAVYRFYISPDDAEGKTFSISTMIANLGYRNFEGSIGVYLSEAGKGEFEDDPDILDEFIGSNALTPALLVSESMKNVEAAELGDGQYELTFVALPASAPGTAVVIEPITECGSLQFEIKDGKLVYEARPCLLFEKVQVEPLDYFISSGDGVRCVFADLKFEVTNNSGIAYHNGFSFAVEYNNGVFMPSTKKVFSVFIPNPIEAGETVSAETQIYYNVNSPVKVTVTECIDPFGAGEQDPILQGNVLAFDSYIVYHELSFAGDAEVFVDEGKVTLSVPVMSCAGDSSKNEVVEDYVYERDVTCSVCDAATGTEVASATATYSGKWQEPKTLVFAPDAALAPGDYIAVMRYTSEKYGFGTTEQLILGAENGTKGLDFTISSSSVADIEADSEGAAAEVYSISGQRVVNPGPGVYIVRRGAKASKVCIK